MNFQIPRCKSLADLSSEAVVSGLSGSKRCQSPAGLDDNYSFDPTTGVTTQLTDFDDERNRLQVPNVDFDGKSATQLWSITAGWTLTF
mgnify:CR=1 FL=1